MNSSNFWPISGYLTGTAASGILGFSLSGCVAGNEAMDSLGKWQRLATCAKKSSGGARTAQGLTPSSSCLPQMLRICKSNCSNFHARHTCRSAMLTSMVESHILFLYATQIAPTPIAQRLLGTQLHVARHLQNLNTWTLNVAEKLGQRWLPLLHRCPQTRRRWPSGRSVRRGARGRCSSVLPSRRCQPVPGPFTPNP